MTAKMASRRVLAALSMSMASVLPVASALAEGGALFGAPPTAAAREPLSAGGGVLQVMVSLAIVLGAILLLGWVARRMRVLPRGRSGALRVVDEIALGAKERAVILEVDGARLVLGVGEGRVALLHRSEALSSPASATTPAAEGATVQRFGDLLNRALGR